MLELLAYLEDRNWLWDLQFMQVTSTSEPMYYATVNGCSCRSGHHDPYTALLCAVAHAMTEPSGDLPDEHDTLTNPDESSNVHTLKPKH